MKKIIIVFFMYFISIILIGCDKAKQGFPSKDELANFGVTDLENYFTFTNDFYYNVSSNGNSLSIYFNYNNDNEIVQLAMNLNNYLHNKSLFSFCGYPGQSGMFGGITDAYNSNDFLDYVSYGIYLDENKEYKLGTGGLSINFIYQLNTSNDKFHIEISYVNKEYNNKKYPVELSIKKNNFIGLWEYGKDDYYNSCAFTFNKVDFLYFYEEYKKQNNNLLFFGIDNSNYYAEVYYRFTAGKIYKEAYDNKIYNYKYVNPSVGTTFIYKDNLGNEKYRIYFASSLGLTKDMFDDLSNLDYSRSESSYKYDADTYDIYADGIDIGYITITKTEKNLTAEELNDPDYNSKIISRFLITLSN